MNNVTYNLKYLTIIEPLGFLYGSAGRFLSPENLVGRSGAKFPPSSTTLSGVFAANLNDDERKKLCVAGPFWGKTERVHEEQNFYVPTPLNYLVKNGQIQHKLHWDDQKKGWYDEEGNEPADKFDKSTWIPINQWDNPTTVESPPWRFTPHLHPRLAQDQRRVYIEDEDTPAEDKKGSLFLENAVEMSPDTCLVYLSSQALESGWYRFGGEGHMVEITCIELNHYLQNLLKQPIENQLALITPAVWGSNRLSYRYPVHNQKEKSITPTQQTSDTEYVWNTKTIFTSRAHPFRYRFGNHEDPTRPKLLSRGRYAVPAGTVYVLEDSLSQSWLEWDESWFPREGVSFKRWGCGLALPIKSLQTSG
ncbi:CRISPR-associated protein Cmr3 [Cyanobacterium stanieri LEGE 03274]|uniref:CRISPR-associated protein Cmr3 n=1 Tax=Cyanobacterium stanieri LEGE 03274 TaxID=1828756 RepID=A0ABR9V712_9CHRO|nr:type III-B CRISPR module-associated Cmr3 family protein [Cyanobacterium stanieri]MBE9222619.1 CRISPR-associated protein Cmr3 [Cyanobacterium stanieri LEGE 03274]